MKNNNLNYLLEEISDFETKRNESNSYYDKLDFDEKFIEERDIMSDDDFYGSEYATLGQDKEVGDLFPKYELWSHPDDNSEVYRTYDKYADLMSGVYLETYKLQPLKMHTNNLMICKTQNPYCKLHFIHEIYIFVEDSYWLLLGNCWNPDNISKILERYLKKGECTGPYTQLYGTIRCSQ